MRITAAIILLVFSIMASEASMREPLPSGLVASIDKS